MIEKASYPPNTGHPRITTHKKKKLPNSGVDKVRNYIADDSACILNIRPAIGPTAACPCVAECVGTVCARETQHRSSHADPASGNTSSGQLEHMALELRPAREDEEEILKAQTYIQE